MSTWLDDDLEVARGRLQLVEHPWQAEVDKQFETTKKQSFPKEADFAKFLKTSGMTLDDIKNFRQLGAKTAGHPEFGHATGIETTTGPLGQGIANAFGMAVAEAYLNARFGSDLVNHFTYAFVGDGCLQEGVGQEMISLAGHLRLGKLVLLWDDNQITDDGSTALSISENVAERFRVAGWHVVEVDGHDIEAVSAALEAARADPRPSLLACRTVIAKGIARLQGQRGGHSGRLFPEDAQAARELLGWPHGPFEVPAEVQNAWRTAGQRSQGEYAAWQQRVAALPAAARAEFERVMKGELPANFQQTALDAIVAANKATLAAYYPGDGRALYAGVQAQFD